MSNNSIKSTFTPQGKSEITRILQLLQEANKVFKELNADENAASLDFHTAGNSLNHCIRWGLQAAEDINEAVGNPTPPEVTIDEIKTQLGVLVLNSGGVEYETFADERSRSVWCSEQDASVDTFFFMDVKGFLLDCGLATTGKDALADLEEDELDVYVIVTGDATDPEDDSLPGAYLINVSLKKAVLVENLTKEQESAIAKAVLVSFHDHQGIENLDDFDIAVHLSNGAMIHDSDNDTEVGKPNELVTVAEHYGKVSIDEVPFDFEGKDELLDAETGDVTAIPYTYRDADNYKEHSTIYVSGELSDEDWVIIRAALSDGNEFIPFDLDLDIDELQDRLTSFPSSGDHVFHEIDRDGIGHLDQCPEGATIIDKAEFIQAFARCSQAWDVVRAEIRLNLGSAKERQESRVAELPQLRNSAGSAFTFHVFAMSAIQACEGDFTKVDWVAVETDTIAQSMMNHKQPAESVLKTLLQHSPGAVTQKQRDAIEEKVNAMAIDLLPPTAKAHEPSSITPPEM